MNATLTADSAARALGLPETPAAWCRAWDTPLSEGDRAAFSPCEEAVLRHTERLGFAETLRAFVRDVAEGVERDPAMREACIRLNALIHGPIAGGAPLIDPWPKRPASPTERADGFELVVLLAGMDRCLARDAQRGIPEAVTFAGLRDLARWAQSFREHHGRWGFDQGAWVQRHLAGRVYELGRLQFEVGPTRFAVPEVSEGQRIFHLHVPATGALSPEACDESFAQARAFFPRYFPGVRSPVAVCESWLLDEQLAHYLPADSNIPRFQKRFTVVPAWGYDDGQTLDRAFGPDSTAVREGRYDGVTPRTSLQRAVLEHLRRGGAWRVGVGYLPWNPG